jgi:hypothetical protein
MASLTINYPDNQQQRIRDALCAHGDYQETLPDGTANPVSRAAFAREQIISFIRRAVRQHERDQARNAALAAADAGLPADPDLN